MEDSNFGDEAASDIAKGYARKDDGWICLICREHFESGVIYEIGGRHYEAGRAVREHVAAAHGSVFRHLLATQEKYTGLTQRQAEALGLMFEGHSDKAIAGRLSGTDNTSSIRNLRFQLKEREKQAKAYLALMEAFRLERDKPEVSPAEKLPVHTGATLSDERFEITEKERAAVLKAYFNADGALKEFPVREKRKIIALQEIALRFEAGRAYTEKEVNAVIGWHDFATVRRYLIEYGFLERPADCSEYKVKEKRNGAD